jgi:hypothetical protein
MNVNFFHKIFLLKFEEISSGLRSPFPENLYILAWNLSSIPSQHHTKFFVIRISNPISIFKRFYNVAWTDPIKTMTGNVEIS